MVCFGTSLQMSEQTAQPTPAEQQPVQAVPAQPQPASAQPQAPAQAQPVILHSIPYEKYPDYEELEYTKNDITISIIHRKSDNWFSGVSIRELYQGPIKMKRPNDFFRTDDLSKREGPIWIIDLEKELQISLSEDVRSGVHPNLYATYIDPIILPRFIEWAFYDSAPEGLRNKAVLLEMLDQLKHEQQDRYDEIVSYEATIGKFIDVYIKNRTIARLKEEIANKDEEIANKDEEIARLKEEIAETKQESEKTLETLDEKIIEKEAVIQAASKILSGVKEASQEEKDTMIQTAIKILSGDKEAIEAAFKPK